MSDVPLGVWLSGGLDSSSLVHYAAEASGSRLKTFSITFRGRSFDEARYARQVADMLWDRTHRARSQSRTGSAGRDSRTGLLLR